MDQTLYVIQPLMVSYRSELLETLRANYKLVLLSDHTGEGKNGFRKVPLPKCLRRVNARISTFFSGRFSYQSKVLSRPYRPGDAVIIFANPRYISFWLLLFLARLKRLKVFAHGQGNFAHPSSSLVRKLIYRTICGLSCRYVCYNEFVRSSMISIGCDSSKLVVADNSVQFDSQVTFASKDFTASGVLFIGRLRHGCCLDIAVEAVSKLREKFPDVCLHVIGGGEEEQRYRADFSALNWVQFYGALYDDQQVSAISRECRVGCYPGHAGLSVVHYFALSLPVVVHSEISRHMGPEPAYVIDGVNGFLFDLSGSPAIGLAGALQRVWGSTSTELREIGQNAFATYQSLTCPTLGQRFVRILTESGFNPTGPDVAGNS